jgi:deoxyribodipyrimidine photo-lyase
MQQLMDKVAVFLFHRDFRLSDNTTLISAISQGYKILPVFIFTPEQINPVQNEYFSHPSVQFMCESLEDLHKQLRGNGLFLFKGETVQTLKRIHSQCPFTAFFSNQDYSKYARDRDAQISAWCESMKISFSQKEDYGLLPLSDVMVPATGKPYTVLSQFYKRILRDDNIRAVTEYKYNKRDFVVCGAHDISVNELNTLYVALPDLAIHGGRTRGLAMLDNLKNLKNYQDTRDYPATTNGTSKASPHLKFGTVSIREMYWEIVRLYGKEHGLIRELVFRDFYMKIYALKPELQRGVALHEKLDKKIKWSYDKDLFEAWKEGKTGFPLVDAGMRELNKTGHQHNRIRMLCGSVLTKYFLIDWRWGLKYYYTHLVDADIFSNTAGWGFVSSTGPDAVPYFRAPFNPFIQSSKFDKDAEYIKKWVPELKDVPPKDIHNWFSPSVRSKMPNLKYPAPIVDHKMASARAMDVFKKAWTG